MLVDTVVSSVASDPFFFTRLVDREVRRLPFGPTDAINASLWKRAKLDCHLLTCHMALLAFVDCGVQ